MESPGGKPKCSCKSKKCTKCKCAKEKQHLLAPPVLVLAAFFTAFSLWIKRSWMGFAFDAVAICAQDHGVAPLPLDEESTLYLRRLPELHRDQGVRQQK